MLIGKQLRSYLAYAVLGSKPMGRAYRAQPRKGPPRDEAYKAWIRSLPCAACGIEGRSEAAHTGSDGGMSMKASDHSCVPLCLDCHTQAPWAYHRIGKRAFEQSQQVDFADLVARLNHEWRGNCA